MNPKVVVFFKKKTLNTQQIRNQWLDKRRPESMSRRIFVEEPLWLGFYQLSSPAAAVAAGAGLAVAAACAEYYVHRRQGKGK